MSKELTIEEFKDKAVTYMLREFERDLLDKKNSKLIGDSSIGRALVEGLDIVNATPPELDTYKKIIDKEEGKIKSEQYKKKEKAYKKSIVFVLKLFNELLRIANGYPTNSPEAVRLYTEILGKESIPIKAVHDKSLDKRESVIID